AWIDCAQLAALRGIYSRGRLSGEGPLEPPKNDTRWRIPVELPWSLVNKSTLPILNAVYYAANRPEKGMRRVYMNSFLHPLDHIAEWNRIYGRRGFFQYQFVVPSSAMAAIPECVRQISKTDQRPSLAVLKAFGSCRSPGLLSFPMEGLTFALDFPNKGLLTLRLLDRLDAVVREAKGRIYLAKDGRLSPQMIHAIYPATEEFAEHVDPAFSSDLWKRASA